MSTGSHYLSVTASKPSTRVVVLFLSRLALKISVFAMELRYLLFFTRKGIRRMVLRASIFGVFLVLPEPVFRLLHLR